MVDRHVDEQRLLLEVVPASTVRARCRIAAKVDGDLEQPAQRGLVDHRGDRARSGEVAVVLADHEHQSSHPRRIHQLLRQGHTRRERLLDQHVEAGVERGRRQRDVRRERCRVEDCFRLGGCDRFFQRFEAQRRGHVRLFAQRVERVRVFVDVSHQLDFFDLRNHLSRPVAAVRTESDLEQTKRSHGGE